MNTNLGNTKIRALALRLLPTAALLTAAPLASALVIDNDIASGTLGHWSVDVTTGGESREANLTANRLASGDTYDEDVLFDYFTYVDIGMGSAFRLSGSTPTSTGDDEVTSSGSFAGSLGNTINWTAVSSIADGSTTMQTAFGFEGSAGSLLGDIRLFQYMDEDVEGSSDDVFFTRGDASTLDLELFTVDDTEVYGVSHSGALDGSQGLVNAAFAGWAGCEYNDMKPAISGSTQSVSSTGELCGDLATAVFSHPDVGTAYGPIDVVSVLAWDVNADQSSAQIITTIGGIADISDIPDDPTIPEPSSLLLVLAGALGLRLRSRRV